MKVINVSKRTIGGIAPGKSADLKKPEAEKLTKLYSSEIKSAASQAKPEDEADLKEATVKIADLEKSLTEANKATAVVQKDLDAAMATIDQLTAPKAPSAGK